MEFKTFVDTAWLRVHRLRADGVHKKRRVTISRQEYDAHRAKMMKALEPLISPKPKTGKPSSSKKAVTHAE